MCPHSVICGCEPCITRGVRVAGILPELAAEQLPATVEDVLTPLMPQQAMAVRESLSPTSSVHLIQVTPAHLLPEPLKLCVLVLLIIIGRIL